MVDLLRGAGVARARVFTDSETAMHHVAREQHEPRGTDLPGKATQIVRHRRPLEPDHQPLPRTALAVRERRRVAPRVDPDFHFGCSASSISTPPVE